MSRLIIKNLPPYATSTHLKQHFTQKGSPGGIITDVKVAQKSDGTSRRFAFIGFKTEEEAKRAQEWFDRTYLDASRISVQIVEQRGTKEGSSAHQSKKRRLEADVGVEPTNATQASPEASGSDNAPKSSKTKENKKELDEFMEVMKPRTKKERTWANDAFPGPSVTSSKEAETRQDPNDEGEDSNLAHVQDVADDIDDLEWMKRRMTGGVEENNSAQGLESETLEKTRGDGGQLDEQPTDDTPASSILRTGRLFLRNLSYSCEQADLETLFSSYGTLSQVHIPLDPITKASKGLAFVTFQSSPCAVKAYEELDKTPFQGRLLHILPAAVQKSTEGKEIQERDAKTVKGDRDKKRKENAGKEFNWSFLYMNSDAVASSIADRMNIPKAEILNPEGGDDVSAAVKLALAETHIIQETRSYLESEGINISAFSALESSDRNTRARRSDTCILVKNIPYGTTAEQIRSLFEPHGELTRVLVPPAGTLAVVDFVHPDEAAKAFRAVAYRRLGSSIVYLEKAPIGIFSETRPKANAKTQPEGSSGATTEDGPKTGDDSEVAPGSTLFVKNLSFATTSEKLASVFRHLPSFVFARVQMKPDPKRTAVPGQAPPRLSMGFGFVGFSSPDAAKKALKSMDGFVLDGHTLSVKFAGRGADADETAETKGGKTPKAKSTKMVVKNVPFEATKKDLRALFGTHGQLKSVRLPKKFDSRARGFAFLDFTSRHEAENAYAALRHTHLLGRHLVLEWAEDSGQDIELLRKRTGVGYGDGAELPGKKRKLELQEDDDDADGDT